MSVLHAQKQSTFDLKSAHTGLRTVTQILPEKPCSDIFGIHLTNLEPNEIADLLLHQRREPGSGCGLVATVNIQHIATMRKDAEFRTAVVEAELVTCDGFPIYRYAQYRGYNLNRRTTGREIVADIMNLPITDEHRLFFLVDGAETEAALRRWAMERGLSDQLAVEVPPMRFIQNDAYCRTLAERVSAFKPTLFFLCTGAPQSEIYVHRYQSLLPTCWAPCVGQSARLVLGLNPQPPRFTEILNIEWLWRIALEPRRMLKRYVPSFIGFLAAVLEDSRARRRAGC